MIRENLGVFFYNLGKNKFFKNNQNSNGFLFLTWPPSYAFLLYMDLMSLIIPHYLS